MHRWLCLLALAPVASLAAVITVNEPWIRPVAAGGATEAFMELTVSESATLVDVRTSAARRVELVQGRQRRAAPFALPIAARERVLMRPRDTHIVFFGVGRTLKRGDRVAFTIVLRYADGTTQDFEVDAEVRRQSPSDDHRAHRH